MLTKTITLRGEEYRLKAGTLSAAVMYEQTTGREFRADSLNDRLTYYWCMLLSSNREKPFMEYFDFLDALDESPQAVKVFNEVLEDANARAGQIQQGEAEGDKKKD